MFFNTYLDPESLTVANQNDKNDLLISILRRWSENCFILVFEDDHQREIIKEKISLINDPDDKKKIKVLLSIFEKRNRYNYRIKPNYENQENDLASIIKQISELDLDFLLLEDSSVNGIDTSKLEEFCSILKYEHSVFEDKRQNISNSGYTLIGNEYGYSEFYSLIFRKALQNANTIQIWDRLLGSKWGDNFDYNMKLFIEYIESITKYPESIKLEIHCEQPSGRLGETIIDDLNSYRIGKISNIEIKVYFYNPRKLSHQRFLITDQIAIDIGRGVDLIDKNTGKNRDTSISIKDVVELNKLLQNYDSERLLS